MRVAHPSVTEERLMIYSFVLDIVTSDALAALL